MNQPIFMPGAIPQNFQMNGLNQPNGFMPDLSGMNNFNNLNQVYLNNQLQMMPFAYGQPAVMQ